MSGTLVGTESPDTVTGAATGSVAGGLTGMATGRVVGGMTGLATGMVAGTAAGLVRGTGTSVDIVAGNSKSDRKSASVNAGSRGSKVTADVDAGDLVSAGRSNNVRLNNLPV